MVQYLIVVVLTSHFESIELFYVHTSVDVQLIRRLVRLRVPLQHRGHRFVVGLLNICLVKIYLLIDLCWFEHCMLPREIKFKCASGRWGGCGENLIVGVRDEYERILPLF